MLAGEYAVLEGGCCLATTLKQGMVLDFHKTTGGFTVESDLWAEPLRFAKLEEIPTAEPALEASRYGAGFWELEGIRVRIASEFAATSGFGSSSAVRLGMLLGLFSLAHGEEPLPQKRQELLQL